MAAGGGGDRRRGCVPFFTTSSLVSSRVLDRRGLAEAPLRPGEKQTASLLIGPAGTEHVPVLRVEQLIWPGILGSIWSIRNSGIANDTGISACPSSDVPSVSSALRLEFEEQTPLHGVVWLHHVCYPG